MTMPFAFPSWVPWWVPVAILVPALLYALVFLAMPFSVFGLKSRLEILEARLDEIQGEIRALVLRLPEPARHDDEFDAPPRTRREAMPRPPIPPAPVAPRPRIDPGGQNPPEIPSRVEPARRFGNQDRLGPDRLGIAEVRSRFGGDDAGPRRGPPPPPPPPQTPPRRAEPRIDWPRPPS